MLLCYTCVAPFKVVSWGYYASSITGAVLFSTVNTFGCFYFFLFILFSCVIFCAFDTSFSSSAEYGSVCISLACKALHYFSMSNIFSASSFGTITMNCNSILFPLYRCVPVIYKHRKLGFYLTDYERYRFGVPIT